jgi:hypothetical protein
MAATDPLHVVWTALESADCSPTGNLWKAQARCPAHEDRRPSLAVAEGVDGWAVIHCRAGCKTEDVVKAMGLRWADLFPTGHRNARRPPSLAKPKPAVQLVLEAVLETGGAYRAATSGSLWRVDVCPSCREGSLWVAAVGKKVRLTCFSGCAQETIVDRLAGVIE